MKVKDITQELKNRGVEFSDCFDKESLLKRLKEARDGTYQPKTSSKAKTEDTTQKAEYQPESTIGRQQAESKEISETDDFPFNTGKPFDKATATEYLRKLKVAELRAQLGKRGIRWSNMIDKEDLVRALVKDMEDAANFSVSGELCPGRVTDIDDKTLEKELGGTAKTPLILDVYATWCGPCQLMSPQFSAAAEELGTKIRFAKMDSDKYPMWSSKLNVGGLPTVIVFSKEGKEVARQEGALMKNMILDLVRPYIA